MTEFESAPDLHCTEITVLEAELHARLKDRRMLFGAEGGAVYIGMFDGDPCVVVDEGTLVDHDHDHDHDQGLLGAGDAVRIVRTFANERDRERYISRRGWYELRDRWRIDRISLLRSHVDTAFREGGLLPSEHAYLAERLTRLEERRQAGLKPYLPRHRNDDPEHDAGYPPYVDTIDDTRRWDRCEDLAEAMFTDLDPSERRTQVWSAIRVFYSSDSPTGDDAESDEVWSDAALTEHELVAGAAANPQSFETPTGVVEVRGLLVGTAEAAAILGVERPRIGRWRALDNGKLPEPVAQLASGPVWLRSQIEALRGSTTARKRRRADPRGE
jgi:hypothetical protein